LGRLGLGWRALLRLACAILRENAGSANAQVAEKARDSNYGGQPSDQSKAIVMTCGFVVYFTTSVPHFLFLIQNRHLRLPSSLSATGYPWFASYFSGQKNKLLHP